MKPKQSLLRQITFDWQNGALSDPTEYAKFFPDVVTAFRKYQIAKRKVDEALEEARKEIQ